MKTMDAERVKKFVLEEVKNPLNRNMVLIYTDSLDTEASYKV